MDCVLKDLIEVSKDGEWGKGEPFADSVEMLAIRGTDFEDIRYGNTVSTPRRHIQKHLAERKMLRPWDVLIEAAGGTKDQITGRTVLLRPQVFLRSSLPLTCASFSRFIRFDAKLCDPEFMFWYLQNLYVSGAMHPYHTQHTGVARFQWTTFSEREPIRLPPVAAQHRIARILSAYDDLIENNQRRIKILETMARALYREWFVHFRFPGHENHPRVASPLGEIPAGWEVIPFEQLLASMAGGDWGAEQPEERNTAATLVVRGTDFDEVAYGGQLRVPLRYVRPSSLASRGLMIGDVVIENSINAKSRSVGSTLLVDSHMLNRLGHAAIAASFCKVFRPHDQRIAPLIHLHARRLREDGLMEYYQNVAANGIANFQAQKFAREENLVIPTDEDLRARLFEPIARVFQSIGVHASQLSILRRTRDLLLPRLLSGQVSFSDLEADPFNEACTSDEASTAQVSARAARATSQAPKPTIDDTERQDVLCTIRQVFNDGGPRDRDIAIRDIAHALGYQRTGSRIREVVSGDLATAVRRGIVTNDGGVYRLGYRSYAECTRESLKSDFESAIGRAWIEREDAIRAFARWGGFGRVGPVIEETARSLINGLIREGRLETDGPDRIRRV